MTEALSVTETQRKSAGVFLTSYHAPKRELWTVAVIAAVMALVLGAVAYFGLLRWGYDAAECVAILFFVVVLARQFIGRTAAITAEQQLKSADEPNRWMGLAFALLLGAAAYAVTIKFFFYDDDFVHMHDMRRPFMISLWPQILHGQFDGHVHIFYRPLGFASLFLDYRLWQSWAPGYHLTNLALHLLCVAGVFFFCRELGLDHGVSNVAAILFAILPVNAQVVTWIACRFDQLATTFMLWALVCSARHRRTSKMGSYVLALALFLLAALSKESAYALPFVWVALELLPWGNKPPKVSSELIKALVGYLAVPAMAFLLRWYILGGLRGYRFEDGSPRAQHFGTEFLRGVFIHAPTEMLFGYNLAQPNEIISLTFLIAATAAIFLTVSLLARRTALSRSAVCLCVLWLVVANLPSHFYFWYPDIALFSSRALHFGSAGLAILLALLLNETFKQKALRIGWTAALSLLLILGLEQNLRAWQWGSQTTHNFLAELKRFDSSPQEGAAFYIAGAPLHVRGIPFFNVGLQSAVQFNFDWRADISAEHLERLSGPITASDPIVVGWLDVHRSRLVILGATNAPVAVRLEKRD